MLQTITQTTRPKDAGGKFDSMHFKNCKQNRNFRKNKT